MSQVRHGQGRWRAHTASVLLVTVVCWSMLLLAAPSCLAREFVHSIEGPFTEPGGVAVDAVGNLWVADMTRPSRLFQFSPSSTGNVPSAEVQLVEDAAFSIPASLALEDSTGHFYTAGEHTWEDYPPSVEVFEASGQPFVGWEDKQQFGGGASVAVDRSTGALYVSHSGADPSPPTGDGLPQGVERLDALGRAVDFECEASKTCPPYVKGNEITGIPGESFGSDVNPAPTGVAVDGKGDIYAVDANYNSNNRNKPRGAVVEFNSEGVFLRACTGEEASIVNWGGGTPHEVAVDPVSGNVLIEVTGLSGGNGVIDEFGSSCHYTGRQITETAPGVRLASALGAMAFDTSGDLYVVEKSESRKVIDAYGVSSPVEARIAPASQRMPTTAVLNGAVEPGGQQLSECYFEYVDEAHYAPKAANPFEAGKKAPCAPAAGEIPADEAFHAVHADLTELVSGTTYRYRLVAKASGGSVATEPLVFTAPAAPRIDATSATNVSSTFADLNAEIDPLGAGTRYHIEYDTREYMDGEPHGVSVPVPDADIGSGGQSGDADVSILQHIGGLTPGLTYHFRVVATNEVGTTTGAVCEGEPRPECTFTALPQSGEGLPDERAYELLTPPNKGSAEDMFAPPGGSGFNFISGDTGYPSDSGEEFLLGTGAAFGAFAASSSNVYVFRRGETGWQTLPLASPSLGVQGIREPVFDPAGFSLIAFSNVVGSAPSPEGSARLDLLGPPGGPYMTLLTELRAGPESGVIGASRDLAHVVLQVQAPALLPPQQIGGGDALYEWSNGGLALASVDPNGSPFTCGARLGQGAIPGTVHDAVSADGSRVFFTAPDPYARKPQGEGCWNETTGEDAPQLYMRSQGSTIEVSAPEAGTLENGGPPVQHPAVYVGASEDGSKVFFVTETELTGEAAALKLHDPELYECEVVTGGVAPKCRLTRISRGEAGGEAGRVVDVPAMSTEGTAVYFASFAELASGAPPTASKGLETPVDIYRYDTSTSTTTYVATVERRDYPQNNSAGWWHSAMLELPEGVALDTRANWYTTPDGRYLLFATTREVTGYSTVEASGAECQSFDTEETTPLRRCTEVYRYDSELPLSHGQAGATENPVCISCDPSGVKPVSDAIFGTAAAPLAPAGGQVRAMSDDGLCAFFDTADPLVPQDGNGTLDVYEWQAPDSGRCETNPPPSTPVCEQPRGCLRLISSGVDPQASFFLGASTSGHDAFLGTHARLVPQDTDNAGDLYDARVLGGFGVRGGVGPCEGDACQNPPPVPIDATPGSLMFSGRGNAAARGTHTAPKALTNAQKLARALNACRKKPKSKRNRCRTAARKRYGKKAKSSPRARTSGRTGR